MAPVDKPKLAFIFALFFPYLGLQGVLINRKNPIYANLAQHQFNLSIAIWVIGILTAIFVGVTVGLIDANAKIVLCNEENDKLGMLDTISGQLRFGSMGNDDDDKTACAPATPVALAVFIGLVAVSALALSGTTMASFIMACIILSK